MVDISSHATQGSSGAGPRQVAGDSLVGGGRCPAGCVQHNHLDNLLTLHELVIGGSLQSLPLPIRSRAARSSILWPLGAAVLGRLKPPPRLLCPSQVTRAYRLGTPA